MRRNNVQILNRSVLGNNYYCQPRDIFVRKCLFRLVLDQEVTLDCVAKEEGVNIGCRQMEGANDAQCYCDSDLCNGTTPTSASLSLLTLISLSLARLFLH